MTWSYNLAALDTSEKDQIRTLVGDVDQNAQLLQDEEIEWSLTQERNLWAAAARCAEMIGFLFMRKVDVRLGRAMQVVYSKTAEQYFAQAKWLRAKAMGTVVPYVGGMNIADKETIENNDNLVEPIFTKTMQQNPWTGGYSSDSLAPTESGIVDDWEGDEA